MIPYKNVRARQIFDNQEVAHLPMQSKLVTDEANHGRDDLEDWRSLDLLVVRHGSDTLMKEKQSEGAPPPHPNLPLSPLPSPPQAVLTAALDQTPETSD